MKNPKIYIDQAGIIRANEFAFEDQEQAKELIFYKLYGGPQVDIPWAIVVYHYSGKAFDLPVNYSVEVKETCKWHGNMDACANETCWDLVECQKSPRAQVAILIPNQLYDVKLTDDDFKEWIGDKSEVDSQDDLWADLLKTMGFFPAPKYLVEVKEKFTITRK